MVDTIETPILGLEERSDEQRTRDVIRGLHFGSLGVISDFTPEEILRFASKHPEYDYLLALTYINSSSGKPLDSLILRTKRRTTPLTDEEIFKVRREMQARLVEENPSGLTVVREGRLSFDPGRTIRERGVITPIPSTFEAMSEIINIPGYEFIPEVSPTVRIQRT